MSRDLDAVIRLLVARDVPGWATRALEHVLAHREASRKRRPRLATVQIEQVIGLLKEPRSRMDRYAAALALQQAQRMLRDWLLANDGGRSQARHPPRRPCVARTRAGIAFPLGAVARTMLVGKDAT
jgi:hypothetical protein